MQRNNVSRSQPPRAPSNHPDRSASSLGIVNPVELAIKRCATSETDAIGAYIKAHDYHSVFIHVPGMPRQENVVGKLEDGRYARIKDIEQVWNDKLFIDHCFGQGAYKSVCRELKKKLEVELLEMAEVVYVKVN